MTQINGFGDISDVNLYGLGATDHTIVNRGGMQRLFDVSLSQSDRQALEPELVAIMDQIHSSDLTGMQQALMMDIVLSMSEIMKQNMREWQDQANLSYEAGLASAEHIKKQASHQMTAGMVNASAQMGMGLADLGTNLGNTIASTAGKNAIVKETNEMDWRKNPQTGRVDANGEIATPAVEANEKPPAYSAQPPQYEHKEIDLVRDAVTGEVMDQGEIPVLKKDASGDAIVKGSGANSRDRSRANRRANGEEEIDLKEKNKYLTDRLRNMYSDYEMKGRTATALAQVFSQMNKMIATKEENDGMQEQALSSIEQTVGQWLMNQSQFTQGVYQQMNQFLGGIQDYLRACESARHQSATGIASAV